MLLNFDYSNLPRKRREEMEDLLGRPFSEKEAAIVMDHTQDLFYNEYFLDDHLAGNIDRQRRKFIQEIINMKRNEWSQQVPANSIL